MLNGNLQLGRPKQNKYVNCKHAGRESTILTQLFMKISSNLTQKMIKTIKNSSLLLTCGSMPFGVVNYIIVHSNLEV